jgi:DNA primase
VADSTNITERIKQKLDIVEEIGAIVPLRKSGKAFKGLCPFHSERTPSFYVFPESGRWHCFGCHEQGDIFNFVEKQQGLEFRDALAQLAERAGIELERASARGDGAARESEESAAKRRMRAINEAAAIWFHHQLLQASEAQYARRYLDARGVSNESIALWRLGYAPEGDRLAAYLQGQGFSANELIEAGFARERDAERGGGLYDYFRNRIIFPIRDSRGQTIAFGGRELGGGHPKYLNTPQTPLFDKSATLYGLDLAREAIRHDDRVVIVEGYMDAIVTHQYGSRTVVACIGSAITEKHVRQINKLTKHVVLALDPDAAGDSASLRGIIVAQQAFDRIAVPVPLPSPGPTNKSVNVRWSQVVPELQTAADIAIARLPDGVDPDEFVRRDQIGWQRAIDTAQPLFDFMFDAQTAGLDLNAPSGKAEAVRHLFPVIAEFRDRLVQDAYIRRLAAKLRLDERDLEQDFQPFRRQKLRDARRTPERHSTDESADQTASGVEAENPTDGVLAQKYGDTSLAGYSALGTSMSASAPLGVAGRIMAEQAQEEICLGLLLERPSVWPEIQPIVYEADFAGTETRALFHAMAQALDSDAPFDVQLFLDALPPVLQAAAERARSRLGPGAPEEGTGLTKMASNAAYRLKRTRLREEMAELDYLQRDAEQSGDSDAVRSLLGRKQQLLTQRRAIDAAASVYG